MAGQWTRAPSATPLQPKKWNSHFWITFNFWWSARLVDRLEPHPPPPSSQKNKMLIFALRSTSDDSGLVNGLETHLPPLSSQKNKMLIFGLRSISGDWPGWSMDSNPICHPSPAKKIKCSFFDYVQLLMIGRAGWWTQTPFTTPLQPKKWNAHFCIMFNFRWLAGLVDGLEPHPPPFSSQKNKMLIFGLHSTSDDWPAGWWTQTPSATVLHLKK